MDALTFIATMAQPTTMFVSIDRLNYNGVGVQHERQYIHADCVRAEINVSNDVSFYLVRGVQFHLHVPVDRSSCYWCTRPLSGPAGVKIENGIMVHDT